MNNETAVLLSFALMSALLVGGFLLYADATRAPATVDAAISRYELDLANDDSPATSTPAATATELTPPGTAFDESLESLGEVTPHGGVTGGRPEPGSLAAALESCAAGAAAPRWTETRGAGGLVEGLPGN